MKSISTGEWSEHKTKELFAMSHKMLDIAQEISEYSTNEMQILVNHSLALAKYGANNEFKKVEKIQTEAAIDATIRISEYRTKVKMLLINVHSDLSKISANYMQTSLDSIADLIEHRDNKMPELNERHGSGLRVMSAAFLVAFEESQKLIISTINNVDELFHKVDKQAY